MRRALIRNSDARLDVPRRPPNPLFLMNFYRDASCLARLTVRIAGIRPFQCAANRSDDAAIDTDASAFRRLQWMHTQIRH